MDSVATECVKARHHPEWANVYDTVHVRWTTHRPAGLSTADVQMAKVCDELATQYGEVGWGDKKVEGGHENAQVARSTEELVGMARESAGATTGDCCRPRGSQDVKSS